MTDISKATMEQLAQEIRDVFDNFHRGQKRRLSGVCGQTIDAMARNTVGQISEYDAEFLVISSDAIRAQAAEIERLQAQLATARREGAEEMRKAAAQAAYTARQAVDCAPEETWVQEYQRDVCSDTILALPLPGDTQEGQPPKDTGWPSANAVAELSEYGGWKSCSGCHESNEGVPTGQYNPALRVHVGIGCRECGGIGAVWDATDYSGLGDMQEGDAP